MTSQTMRQRPSRRRGFTLVEMLLVVIIISVTAAIAVPRYTRSFERMKLRSAALDVAATIEHAQSRAVIEGRLLRLTVSEGGAVLTVERDESDSSETPFRTLMYRLPEGVKVASIDFADTLLGHRKYLVFSPDARTQTCDVEVTGRTGEAYLVHVESGFGRTLVALRAQDESGLIEASRLGG